MTWIIDVLQEIYFLPLAFHALLVWCDGRTLDADLVLLDCLCGIDCHGIVCLPPGQSSAVCFGRRLCLPGHGTLNQGQSTWYPVEGRGGWATRMDDESTASSCEANEQTSSLIFFHMILVISSPSSSTTGCETAIFCAFSECTGVSVVVVALPDMLVAR